MIQEEVRMQLQEKSEKEGKSGTEEKTRLRKIQNAVAAVATEQKAMAKMLMALVEQVGNVKELRGGA